MSRIDVKQTLDDHQERVWSLCWNPTGTLFASCSGDKTIKIWGLEGERWVCKSTLSDQHKRTVRDISWSPCGQLLAAASFDSTISIWDRSCDGDSNGREFECVATLEGHENEVKSVEWSVSGTYLASCSRDKTVWVWECIGDGEYECASVLTKHSQDVKKVRWHPHVDILASCSYDDTIKVYNEDDDDWTCTDSLSGHTSTVWSLDFDGSGDRIVSCSDDSSLKIWQCYKPGNKEGFMTSGTDPTWKCVCTLSGLHKRAIYDVDWNRQSGMILTAGGDNKISLIRENVSETSDPKNEPCFEVIASVDQAHHQDVNCVAWNPVYTDTFISCSDDMNIKVWKVIADTL